ncbi:MAG: OmpH family outer membrane protein [Thiotrichaceae bacterium]
MKKHYIYLGITLLCSLYATTLTAKELKIGFVNAVKVMEQAPQVSAANTRLEREFEPRQREIANGQREIKALEDKLTKDGAIMSEAQSRDMSRDIVSKKRDLKRQQDEFREDYNIRRNEELDKLQKQIIEVIQAVAKEQSYDLILSDGVVWASDSIDMTDQVLKRLGISTRSSAPTTGKPRANRNASEE